MTTKEERIEKALDTLAELCEAKDEVIERDVDYGRRASAEAILGHYSQVGLIEALTNITIHVNGAVPVRPMTRAEVSA